MAESNNDTKQFFETALRKSGYSLQSRVENKLREIGYTVAREQPYVDLDEGKGRSIDLIAKQLIPKPEEITTSKKIVSGIEIVIECKNLPDHAWVFFGGKNTTLPIPQFRSLTEHLPQDQDRFSKMLPLYQFPEIFHATDYAEFFRDNKKENKGNEQLRGSKSNKKDINFHDALHKVIKATKFRMDVINAAFAPQMQFFSELDVIMPLSIFHSIIVFQGYMYRADIVNGEDKLTEIKCVEVPKKYVSPNYKEEWGIVHVVHFDYLDDYMKILQKRLLAHGTKIIANQETLMQFLKEYHKRAYPQYNKTV